VRNLDAMYLGELREATAAADGAIFNVLNTGNATNLVTMTDDQLHNREPVTT